jgi:hypothetical protein
MFKWFLNFFGIQVGGPEKSRMPPPEEWERKQPRGVSHHAPSSDPIHHRYDQGLGSLGGGGLGQKGEDDGRD